MMVSSKPVDFQLMATRLPTENPAKSSVSRCRFHLNPGKRIGLMDTSGSCIEADYDERILPVIKVNTPSGGGGRLGIANTLVYNKAPRDD